MSTFPGSPRLVKGGLVLVDPASSAVRRVITLQYNPDTITRSLQIKGVAGEGGDRSEALRLTGPPVESIKLEAEMDATDQLEFPEQNAMAVDFGIAPQLAVLEALAYPSSDQIQDNASMASAGSLEIIPVEALMVLFVWSKNRVVPVRLTEFSIVEEAFDPQLNPIRAKVSLGLRVLGANDFLPDHPGFGIFLSYLRRKENLAGRVPTGGLSPLGLTSIH